MSSWNTDHTPRDQQGRKVDPGHGLIMMLCCVPMLVVGFILLARGEVLLFLIILLLCIAMMAWMADMDSDGNGQSGH